MVCRSAWRTACSWSALLVLCSCLLQCVAHRLLMVSPKGKVGRRYDQVPSVTLVTSGTGPPRASACSCSLVVAPIFLKFYRNILWSIVFKKQ